MTDERAYLYGVPIPAVLADGLELLMTSSPVLWPFWLGVLTGLILALAIVVIAIYLTMT